MSYFRYDYVGYGVCALAWLRPGLRGRKAHRYLWVTKDFRPSVLLACATGVAFIVFLTVFLFQHADPHEDGMEMVGVAFAVMLNFLPLTLPAFILAFALRRTRRTRGGGFFWLETISELGLPKS